MLVLSERTNERKLQSLITFGPEALSNKLILPRVCTPSSPRLSVQARKTMSEIA